MRAVVFLLITASGFIGFVRGSLVAGSDKLVGFLLASLPGPFALASDEGVARVYAAVGAVGLVGLLTTVAGNRGAAAKRRRFERAHAAWDEQAARWPLLAYCSRCDVVFKAGSGSVREREDE